MIGFLQLRTVDSLDPWTKIEIDAATRQLAEHAAATAGLSVEEWLERAIRRASASALAAAPASTPSVAAAAESPEPEHEALSPALDTSPVAPEIGAVSAVDEMPRPRFDVNGMRRWAVMAAGVVLAIAAGVVSAQYLIPDRSRAIHVTLEPTIPAAVPLLPAPSIVPTAAQTGPAASTLPASPASSEPAPAASGSTVSPPPAPTVPTASPAPPPAAVGKPPPAGQETLPRKTALAKPPVAAGITTARRSPSTTTQDATAKGDKAEAPSDPQQLAPWLEARAETGDAISQYRLGVLYALGEGVTQDYQRAAALFKTAAEKGVTEAEYNVAVMYAEGLGIGRDPKQAIFWYRKAAAQGSASAAFNLGVAYSNGIGIERNMDQAAQWFRRAAESGVVNAQFNIGLLYERGEGVSPSQIEAYAWYATAAAHGDTGAAQRRDRLADTLSPAVLKDAQARAEQIQTALQSGGDTGSSAAPSAVAPAALKP